VKREARVNRLAFLFPWKKLMDNYFTTIPRAFRLKFSRDVCHDQSLQLCKISCEITHCDPEKCAMRYALVCDLCKKDKSECEMCFMYIEEEEE